MASSGFILGEGQSTTRPLAFSYRMQAYICSIDCDIWDIVENGFTRPSRNVNDIIVDIPTNELDASMKSLIILDWKAKNILYCALGKLNSIGFLHILVHMIFGLN